MSVIFLLVIIGVVVAGLFLGGFIWAVRSGQYDDTYTPSIRMLFEDGAETSGKPESEKNISKSNDQSKLINKPK